MHITPAIGKLRQEDHKFKVSLGYINSIKKERKVGGVAQVGVLLLCKHEVLSSNSSSTKNKIINKKERRKRKKLINIKYQFGERPLGTGLAKSLLQF
jgi:hypothetical protein